VIYLIIAAVNFVRISARSNQQLNVVNFRWLRIIPMSGFMSYTEMGNIAVGAVQYLHHGLLGLFLVGTATWVGSWLGCWAGMWAHLKLERRKRDV